MTDLRNWLAKLLPRRRARKPAVDFKALAESSGDILLLLTTDHHLRYVSPSVTDILGWLPEDMRQNGPGTALGTATATD